MAAVIRRTWQLETPFLRAVTLVLRDDVLPEEEPLVEHPLFAAAYLRDWLFGEGGRRFARERVLDLYRALSGFDPFFAAGSSEAAIELDVLPALAAALEDGSIVSLRVDVPEVFVPKGLEADVEPLGPEDAAEEELTYIEVEIVDQDGNPVAGRAYTLTLPDGTKQTGRVPTSGILHVGDLEPGSGQIDFNVDDGDAQDAGDLDVDDSPYVDFQILDDDGNPIPNIAFVLQLSDGTTKDGLTDENGHAHVGNLVDGDCTLVVEKLH
jgi:hypothetical protein